MISRECSADDAEAVGEVPVEIAVNRRMIESVESRIQLRDRASEIVEQCGRAARREPSVTPETHVSRRTK